MSAWMRRARKYRVKRAFDPALVLEEDGRDLVHCLDLLEALLDHGLALVACRTSAGDRVRSLVIRGYIPSLLVVVGDASSSVTHSMS